MALLPKKSPTDVEKLLVVGDNGAIFVIGLLLVDDSLEMALIYKDNTGRSELYQDICLIPSKPDSAAVFGNGYGFTVIDFYFIH